MSIERDADTPISCFIIAPSGHLSDLLRKQLEQEGVLSFRLESSDVPWQPTVQATSLVERADFVAVILEGQPSPNIYFEIGLAMGSGKPLLLFNESPKLPSALSSATTVLTSALRNDSWKDLRRAFLRTLKPAHQETRRRTQKKPVGSQRWRKLESEFERLRTGDSESASRQFEHLVERAFLLANFPISRAPTPDFGADFALASPSLMRSFGLPILIEAKNNSRIPLSQKMVDRLEQLISEGRGGAALLVAMQPPSPTVHLKLQRPIVIVPFDEVLNWLEKVYSKKSFFSPLTLSGRGRTKWPSPELRSTPTSTTPNMATPCRFAGGR